MTIDDENSVYVGGIPYDSTEESLRSVFNLYGAVVHVKIINDHATRGKCFAFITFTNPRSAVDAIKNMNGRTIDGRVVRVNEVMTRGGRSNISRESIRHNVERGTKWDRRRDHQERDYDLDRDRHRNNDRSRERDRSRDHDQDRDRGYEHPRDHNQTRDHILDRDRDEDRDLDDNEQERSRKRDQDWDLDLDRDKEMDRSNGHGKSVDKDNEYQSRKRNGSYSDERRDGDLSSDSANDYHDKVKEVLERSIQRREELRKEISQMEERLGGKQQHVMDLQKKSQKLEDALTAAKKLSSHRQMLLTKLHKCFQQVKDCSERLKSSEEELQSLVDTAKLESDAGNDVGFRDGSLTNSKA